MASRMDRYNTSDKRSGNTRSSKNKKLYNSLDNNPTYTTISDIRNTNSYSLSENKEQYRTREGYQKVKEYGDFVETPKVKKELDDFNYLYKDREKKVYDINSVIEEAKKQKEESSIKKKNLDDSLTITKEEIERYKKAKASNRPIDDEDEKMKELINTITSKTLRGEIDQATSVDLLSDLMATSKMDKIKNNEDILDTQALREVKTEMDSYDEVEEEKNKEIKDIDNSFFTKSMDLSDKDFVFEDMVGDDRNKVPGILKFLLVIILAALVGALVYFIYKGY